MKLPENDYQILKLTPMFYEKYLTLLDEKEFQRRYRYSTLKYFHKELRLKNE